MAQPKYTTLIFDLDGTLFYTSEDIANCANMALDKLGYNRLDQETIISHVGGGIHNTIAKILGDAKYNDPNYEWEPSFLEDVVKTYRKLYAEHYLDTTRPYPDVAETIQLFHKKNINMAVVSNKTIDFTRPIVEHYGMDKYFEIILGGDSLENKKPHHEPLEHVIDHYKSKKEQTLIVGDTEKDIEAAKNAGIDSCGVTYGMRKPEVIKAIEPDYFIDNFSELEEIL